VSLHPSLRLKLSAAFAGAMAALFIGLGLFVYSSFKAGLDGSVNGGLRSRAGDVSALITQADSGLSSSRPRALGAPVRGFAQVVRADGSVLDATPGMPSNSLVAPAQLKGITGPRLLDRRVAGIPDGPVRLLAVPVHAQGESLVVIVGTSLRDRSSALQDLAGLLALGGPVALALASLLGYAVAAFSLRSVEAMRRRSSELSVTQPGARLPVPPARDELQRLALTLNEMLERNERAFDRERRFVADASHELRTPLAVLKAELEVALTGEGSASELRQALASADGEADRVIGLAQDLLTIAQTDHGGLPVEPEGVIVRLLLDRIRLRFARRAASLGRIIIASAPENLWIHADPRRLEQALGNLVDNALLHGEGTIVLFAEREGRCVNLHVADSGPGLAEAFLPIAFDRFSRPDAGRTREGAGLGLAIVRSVARAHGGEAHAKNRASGGGEFWLALPQGVTSARVKDPRAPLIGV
jgi:two-component system OmpR family sensor kinase